MDSTITQQPARLTPILVGLGVALLFEALTLVSTQDRAVWTASPWRDDPYHTALSISQFVVPALAMVIAARLARWPAPGRRDRAHQMVRAIGAVTAFVGLTLVVEWAAVIGQSAGGSRSTTELLVVGLVLTSLLTLLEIALLLSCRRAGWAGRWQNDWLGDLSHLCRPVPVLRRVLTPAIVQAVRRRSMTVFLVVSALAGAAITATQAVGERMTDPLPIAWFLVAGTAASLAVCVMSNAVAGFVARPPRTRPHRILEASLVAGCLALVAAIAFHDALWQAFGSGTLTFPALATLTLGAGLATWLVTAALLTAFMPRRADPAS